MDFSHYDQEKVQERAGILEILGRSELSVEFFEKHSVCFLYADDMQYLPYVDDANQFIHRYRVALHLSCWEGVKIKQDYFAKAGLSRLENVDIHHPPE